MYPTASASAEDSYVPMGPQVTTSGLRPHCSRDDYIPMSSGSISSPLPKLPADLEPPPVNRDLKPQRKRKPFDQACCVGRRAATWRSFLPDSLWEGSTRETILEVWEFKGEEKGLELNGKSWGALLPQIIMIKGVRICKHHGLANIAYKAKFIPESSSLAVSLTKAQK